MKQLLFIVGLSGLVACGSLSKPDPRVSLMRQQHQELLLAQKKVAKNLESPLLQVVARLVQESTSIQQALDQLDPGKSQEPAQVALVTELASKETGLVAALQAIDQMGGLADPTGQTETTTTTTASDSTRLDSTR